MSEKNASLVERLAAAGNPRDQHDWEQRDGYYVAACRVSADDVPELIDLVREWSDPNRSDDVELPDIDEAELLPITAWRALGDLKATAAVQPLVELVCELQDECDDWVCEELPHVFGKIGESAIEPLIRLAADDQQPDYTRSIAASGLRLVADYHPNTKPRVVALLTEMMASAREGHAEFNTTVLIELVDLGATEAAEPIERAFAADLLDVGVVGTWDDVRRTLGVESLGLKMPKDPHDSTKGLGLRLGMGIFSDQPIFFFGDIDDDAAEAYYKRVDDAFSKSIEAKKILERYGDLEWYPLLLRFGVDYLGETVDEMKLASIRHFVFGFVPSKVAVEADAAPAILAELTAFWQYLHRAHELSEARSILEWLQSDGLVARLQAEMSDPANFGMAKSIFSVGKQAGYDMASEAERATFVSHYNQSLASRQPTGAPGGRTERVGRNSPCPCGSGKKFKKCCGG